MAIELDHTIVPAKDRDGAAKQLAELLGVPWGPSAVGPFAGVYVNEGTTLDFIQADEPFPVYHFCFRVGPQEFEAILGRLKAARIPFRSQVRGPTDYKVDPTSGTCTGTSPRGTCGRSCR